MSGYLDRINEANDIKKIEPEAYDALASEIRSFIIESVSEHGGHLASNLGVVELTMALHLCMDFPNDKLIWDVGHQAYTHKLLTGRKEDFSGLRTFGGMSGFPKHKESPCDAFDTGHSSTSISAALGYARARDLKGEDRTVVAVIGDGSLTGGMAYEALNNVSHLKSNMIIVLNDNKMFYYNGTTWDNQQRYICGTAISNNLGKIISFNPYNTNQLLDKNDTTFIAEQAMPSSKYVDLELGVSGTTYTALANGYIQFVKQATASGQYMVAYDNDLPSTSVDENTIAIKWSTSGVNDVLYFPVRKGQKFTIGYTFDGPTVAFRIIFAQGDS